MCYFGHRWSMWREYDRSFNMVYPPSTQTFTVNEVRQKRECLVCGYTQDYLVREGRLNDSAIQQSPRPMTEEELKQMVHARELQGGRLMTKGELRKLRKVNRA